MKQFILVAVAGLVTLAGCTHVEGANRNRERGEARLAQMIDGRVAGQPQSCIAAFDMGRMQVLDQTAIVYDAGNTIWVSRPSDPLSLNSHDIVVIERTGGQLCKTDIVRTIDRTNRITTGAVFLGDFVPYRRP